MKVLLAGLYHETHCFVPELTHLADFRVERGAEVLKRRGDGSTIDGFLEVAERRGWQVVPAAAYTAMPSGRVKDDVFEAFWKDVSATIAAEGDGLAAVFLSLHGAMVAETLHDVEGELLARLRSTPATAGLPIFGVFDLHANVTERMVENANALVCYRENPHIDARESSVRAAELLARTLADGVVPRMRRRNPPIIWPPTGTGTADAPMSDLEAAARVIEQETPSIWAVNVVGGYSFADVAEVGVSISVVFDGPDECADAALDRLDRMAWELREKGLVREDDLDAVLAKIGPEPAGPVLLVEPADNIGGGAPGDGTAILRALLKHKCRRSLVIINDPASVANLHALQPGATATLAIGGKGSALDEGPVVLHVKLLSKSDGRFELEDPNSHLAAMQGRFVDMGPSAVVRHEGVTILLTSRKTPPFDLGQLRSQGIQPETLGYIGVKAAVAHRRAYDPIAAASYTVSTKGACSSDPRVLPYRHARRPIFPLDEIRR